MDLYMPLFNNYENQNIVYDARPYWAWVNWKLISIRNMESY